MLGRAEFKGFDLRKPIELAVGFDRVFYRLDYRSRND